MKPQIRVVRRWVSIVQGIAAMLVLAFLALGQMIGKTEQSTQSATADSKMADLALFLPTEIQWKDGPASLPGGAKVAVLEGDPAKEGFFTMRLWLPNGFRIPPHWHTQVEHVTVIAGTLNIGMGDKFDQSATRAMPAGTFGFWPAQMRHFAWAKGETIIQLHGQGPWTITYVNPADDPRIVKTS